MKARVGIIGATGYTAKELIRILIDHPKAEISHLVSNSCPGSKIAEIHKEFSGRVHLMCQKLNADTYLSGAGGKAYIEEKKFKEQNVNLLYQDFQHPVYRQQSKPFIPNMSLIDLMFNKGSNHGSDITRNSGGVVPAQL